MPGGHGRHDHHDHHSAPAAQVPEGTIYTCPMHPEIRQAGPGSCPICGMALEPERASLTEGPSPELVDMRRRFRIGMVLTVPVAALEMGGHLIGLDHLIEQQTSNWIQLALATPVVLWAGWPFFVRGWRSVVSRSLNMFTLIAMGIGVAWVYSMVATIAPHIFPVAFRQMPQVLSRQQAHPWRARMSVDGDLDVDDPRRAVAEHQPVGFLGEIVVRDTATVQLL